VPISPCSSAPGCRREDLAASAQLSATPIVATSRARNVRCSSENGVTEPSSIAADGTMFVRVTTNAWMNELSLMEPELLRALNAKEGRPPVRRIRWLLRRD